MGVKKNGFAKMRRVLAGSVRFYQKWISPLLPRSCRYYPTCSEYALWQFRFAPLLPAIYASATRILRCNQLFKGGIDYPVIKKKFASICAFRKNPVSSPEFWFVPCKALGKDKYYLIKVFDSLKEQKCLTPTQPKNALL